MNITRKEALKTLALGLIVKPETTEDPYKNFRAEFMEAWESSEKYTLSLYDQMPENLLDWKYTPESFSWRMQFVHCITFNASQFSARLEIEDPYTKIAAKGGFWPKLNKKKLREEVVKFYDWVRKLVQEIPAGKLSELSSFGSDDIPNWRLFYALENHIIHHRGQAVCYLRLNGITPIGYVGW